MLELIILDINTCFAHTWHSVKDGSLKKENKLQEVQRGCYQRLLFTETTTYKALSNHIIRHIISPLRKQFYPHLVGENPEAQSFHNLAKILRLPNDGRCECLPRRPPHPCTKDVFPKREIELQRPHRGLCFSPVSN